MGMSNAEASGYAASPITSTAGGTSDLKYAKGGGKTPKQQAMNAVVQVNPDAIAGLFRQGAQEGADYYQRGLNFYSQSVQQAAQQIQLGYGQARATLQPLSEAGRMAMNEQMKMLGIAPPSLTAGYANVLNSIAPVGDNRFAGLQQQMLSAESLTDPRARAAAKQGVLNQLDTIAKGADSTSNTKLLEQLGPRPTPDYGAAFYSPGYGGWIDPSKPAPNSDAAKEIAQHKKNLDAEFSQKQKVWDEQYQKINLQGVLDQQKLNQLQQLRNDYQLNYDTSDQTPYTGDQVTKRLEATPGYNFTMNQGTQAIARQGAALGMLASGNTGTALTEFGQNLATSTFNSYMGQLQNIATLGSNATSQIAQYQTDQGQNMATLTTGLGSAVASTYQGIGNLYNNAAAQEAGMRADLGKFNANLQYMSKQANLSRAATSANTAMSAMPGLMNAGTNAAQFGYNVYQSQQAGRGFQAGGGTSGGNAPMGSPGQAGSGGSTNAALANYRGML